MPGRISWKLPVDSGVALISPRALFPGVPMVRLRGRLRLLLLLLVSLEGVGVWMVLLAPTTPGVLLVHCPVLS